MKLSRRFFLALTALSCVLVLLPYAARAEDRYEVTVERTNTTTHVRGPDGCRTEA